MGDLKQEPKEVKITSAFVEMRKGQTLVKAKKSQCCNGVCVSRVVHLMEGNGMSANRADVQTEDVLHCANCL